MNKNVKALIAVVAFLSVLVWSFAVGAEDIKKGDKGQSLAKISGTPQFQILNINNYTSWVRSDNSGNLSPHGDNQGIYPRGTGGNVIYTDGIVWGAKAFTDAAKTTPAPRQTVRVGGKAYGFGQKAGRVTGSGATAVAANPNDADVRIFRVRRDYASMNDDELRRDAAESNEIPIGEVTDAQVAAIKNQYDKDWKEWPWTNGAPYIDRNGNGIYNAPPAFSTTFTVDSLIAQKRDEPGVAGSDPNSPADQVIWTVANDLDVAQTLAFLGSEPVGLEIQYTIWGYKRTDALGNLYFKRVRLINKGGVEVNAATPPAKGSFYLDSVYVCQWSDIDLGNAGDDLAGCDSTLSMGFVYNGFANDNTYKKAGLPPPASGYDFLAGPIVPAPGDSAVVNFKRQYNVKNLGMSSFAYFSAGSPYSDPPNGLTGGYTNTSGQWWKLLRGYAPLGGFNTVDQSFASGTFATSKFPLSGDPTSQKGFVDGLGFSGSFAPGDRRILLNTGPFTMAPGDTQEIVVGTVAGLGADRFSSVAVMKFNDRFVQNTFDALFAVPKPPVPPDVKIAELDGEVVLEWGSNAVRVSDTETKVNQPGSYKFEGYNVYQLPARNSRLSDAKLVAVYDLVGDPTVVLDEQFDTKSGQILRVPVFFGSNSGIQRYFDFKRDYIKDIDKVYNGQEYYVAITAYSVAAVAGYLPTALESTPLVLTVRPKVPFGKALQSVYSDTIKGSHAGPSDGAAIARILDPSAVTGNTYQVRFDTTGGTNTWKVLNTSKSTTLLSGQTNQAADALSPIADGIQWKVQGAPNDLKDLRHVANPSGPLNPATYVGFSSFNDLGFPDPSGQGSPTTDWGGGRWGINHGGGADRTYASFVSRAFRAGANFSRFVPYDFEMRFTAAGGKANLAFTTETVVNVPFELWNIGIGTPNDPSDDHRMIPYINDADGNEEFNLQQVDSDISGSDNDPYTDWVYWYEPANKAPGQVGYNAWVAAGAAAGDATVGGEVIARMVLVNVNGGSVGDPTWPANVNSQMPATGNVIRILSTKPNTVNDVFTVNTASRAPATGDVVTKASANSVGVYPNPYYAFNPAETNRFNRYVTFNNLPQRAKFRIFNLAGQMVRVIDKDDATQFLRWDLFNQNNIPVASGVYVVHIEMPDAGVTKILKVAIIQEQEVLDTY